MSDGPMKVEGNIEITAGFIGTPSTVQEDTLRSIVEEAFRQAAATFEEGCRMAGYELGDRIKTITEEARELP